MQNVEIATDINSTNHQREYTPLMLAASRGDIKTVMRLVSTDGVDIEHRCSTGDNAFILAAYHNHYEIVACLINHNADVNACDSIGRTAIFYAIENNNLQMMEYLLSKNAKFVLQDKWGNTPLIRASVLSFFKACEVLLIKGADPNIANKDGKNAIEFLKECKPCLAQQKVFGIIAIANNPTLKQWLIDLVQVAGKLSLLHFIKKYNDPNQGFASLRLDTKYTWCAIDFLLAVGIDINECDEFKNTALIVAAAAKYVKIVRKLVLVEDINLDHKSHDYGMGSALNASYYNHTDHNNNDAGTIAKILIDSGADINSTDKEGCSIIFDVIFKQNLDVLQFLITRRGINLNLKDNAGNTPLIYAAKRVYHASNAFGSIDKPEAHQIYKQFFAPCIILLQNGAQHSYCNNEDKTAVQYLTACAMVKEKEKFFFLLAKKEKALSNCKNLINTVLNTAEDKKLKLLASSNSNKLQAEDDDRDNSETPAIHITNIHVVTTLSTEKSFDKKSKSI